MNKTKVQYIVIGAEYTEQRIDNYLVAHLKNVPKTHIYKILRKGEVRVNKKRVKPNYRLQAQDQVRLPPLSLTLEAKPLAPSKNLKAFLEERILYEDDGLLIINKPSGMAVHGGSGIVSGMIETLRAIYPVHTQLELAHRLDRDTSGCLIVAKKRSSLRQIHQLLREGEVCKIYLALTKGQWAKQETEISVPLRKQHLESGERVVKIDAEGKASCTAFRQMQTLAGGVASLVEARLYTGRTHQIRVHAQYADHPLAGDDKYGDRDFDKLMREHGLKRLFLHAKSVSFTLPGAEKPLFVTAPLDDELSEFLDKLNNLE